jgi:hypothetical protein
MDINMEVPQEAKNRTSVYPTTLLAIYPKELKSTEVETLALPSLFTIIK